MSLTTWTPSAKTIHADELPHAANMEHEARAWSGGLECKWLVDFGVGASGSLYYMRWDVFQIHRPFVRLITPSNIDA